MSVGSKTLNCDNPHRQITTFHNVHEWTVQDVADWLRQNDFTQYLQLFVQHKIDGTVLLSLNEKDLRKPPLSIETLGDVKKLYFSISRLQLINLRMSPSSHTLSVNGSPNLNRPYLDFNSAEILQLKEQIKCELQQSSTLRKRANCNGFKPNDLSAALDGWSDLNGNDLHADSTETEDNDEAEDENASQNFPLLRMPKGEYQQFKPEAWKALIAMLYFFAVTWLTAIVMVIVHDRVPDMQTFPPLPDIFLDNVPLIPGAFTMCELCGLILFMLTALLLIFHKHRFILIRRMFSLFGSVFLLRCFTMLITSLSVPGRHLDCKARHGGDWIDKLKQAFLIWQGGGMSIQGVRTCGDYMFSGHTVVLTLLNFFITEYTPQRFYFVHTISWVLNLFGVFFILAGHEHYSIDVFIAFYISTRLFLYYHTLANNRALYQGDRKRTRIWFPLFYFFESGVNGIVPNHFEMPCRNWVVRLRKRYHNLPNIPLSSSYSPLVSDEKIICSEKAANSFQHGNGFANKLSNASHNSVSENKFVDLIIEKPIKSDQEEKVKKPKKKKKKKEN